ncbi:unnamed protein product, partial [Thlaspi arvense]
MESLVIDIIFFLYLVYMDVKLRARNMGLVSMKHTIRQRPILKGNDVIFLFIAKQRKHCEQLPIAKLRREVPYLTMLRPSALTVIARMLLLLLSAIRFFSLFIMPSRLRLTFCIWFRASSCLSNFDSGRNTKSIDIVVGTFALSTTLLLAASLGFVFLEKSTSTSKSLAFVVCDTLRAFALFCLAKNTRCCSSRSSSVNISSYLVLLLNIMTFPRPLLTNCSFLHSCLSIKLHNSLRIVKIAVRMFMLGKLPSGSGSSQFLRRISPRLHEIIKILFAFIYKFRNRNPLLIDLGANAFGIDFHPSKNLVAAGLIDGHLHLYRYDTDSTIFRERKVRAHKESCRAVRFIDDGQRIVTASADCSILATDVETGATVARLENAHEDAVNTLITVTETTIASGDDKGCVKIWDTRQRSCSHEFNVHEDYISDMTFASDSMKLVATSGDGTLSVCNLRSNKIQSQSEFSEDELLSVVIMKNGRKVICGTQNGILMLYSWGFFKDCRLITGCDTGILSLVGILPNRIIQPIGSHEFPIEDLALSHDKKFLGSTAHDSMLKLWDLEQILEGSNENASGAAEDSDSDNDGMDMDDDPPKPSKGTKRKTKSKSNPVDDRVSFFADI